MIGNSQRAVRIRLGEMRAFLRRVERELGLAAEQVAVRFVSDTEIARLNREFRGKSGPTDVLSFPVARWKRPMALRGKKPRDGGEYLGDIAISAATARRNARRSGRAVSMELRILILHGALHLVGYDHETDGGRMERIEGRLRRRLRLK